MVLGNAAMKRGIAVVLFGLAVAACDRGGTVDATGNVCTLDAAPDGTSILAGDCPRDAHHIAAAIGRGHGDLASGGEIALGRVPFDPAGPFDRCAVMARLAGDSRWTAAIDSTQAGAPLKDALGAGNLVPSVSDALAKAGRRLCGVSLGTVLLSDTPAQDCPKSPAKAPIEAQVWLLLD
jgi:hypothetical protein